MLYTIKETLIKIVYIQIMLLSTNKELKLISNLFSMQRKWEMGQLVMFHGELDIVDLQPHQIRLLARTITIQESDCNFMKK